MIVPTGTFSSTAYTKSFIVGASFTSIILMVILPVSDNKSYPVIPESVTLTVILKLDFCS
jgi:hypothetical protein